MNHSEHVRYLLDDELIPNSLLDIELLRSSIKNPNEREGPIILTMGESWAKTPSGLTEGLSETNHISHGYQFSLYGVPYFRKTAAKWVSLHERVDLGPSSPLQLAISWTGTRSAMFDFGRLLLSKRETKQKPVVLTFAPGYDYAGIFEPLGFQVLHLPLLPESGFIPDIQMVEKQIIKMRNNNLDPALFAINLQHSPSGNDFGSKALEQLIELSLRYNIGLLFDNAYYGVAETELNQTSALEVLSKYWKEISTTSVADQFFAVRSLGKFYRCNGWALGTVVASTSTIHSFATNFRMQRGYATNGMLQHTMANWMQNDASLEVTEITRKELRDKRAWVTQFFQNDLGYSSTDLISGRHGVYFMHRTPRKYCGEENPVRSYIQELFNSTQVLVTDCWSRPRTVISNPFPFNYARIFIDVEFDLLKEACLRIKKAGLVY